MEHPLGFQWAILGAIDRGQFQIRFDLDRLFSNPLFQLLPPIGLRAVLLRRLLLSRCGRTRRGDGSCRLTAAEQTVAVFWGG